MNIIEWLKVILLGIVEGITEWLPISSTGHMILVDEFIKLNVTADFKNVFEVVIQLGAILAVVVIYFWDLWPFHGKSKAKSKSYFANPSDNKVFAGIQNFVDNYCYLDKIIMWFKIVVSCLPAAVIGLAFNDWIEAHLMNYVIVALMLIIYGVLFIIIENYNKTRTLSATKIKEITWKNALYIGVFQTPFHRTGNFPFGSNHHRRYPAGMLERAGIGVHVFPCCSGYVRRKPFKTGKTRLCLYRC